MKNFSFWGLVLLVSMGMAQTPDILINKDYEHLIDRLDVLNEKDSGQYIFTGVKPYNRESIIRLCNVTCISSAQKPFYIADNSLYQRNFKTPTKGYLKYFYKTPASLYHHSSENFKLSVNPMLYFSNGWDNNSSNTRLFISTRGAEIHGSLDNKLGFYAMAADNQMVVPEYVSDQIYGFGAVPGENFWKVYDENGFDYFTAKGYITFRPIKSIRAKFGYDKNFIGNGYRSMILSNYAGNYTHLRIDTRVWKLNYTNIFADLNADLVTNDQNVPRDSEDPLPRKFLALHRLDVALTKNLNLGLFESVIYGGDSTGQNTININYLNPIVFYRAIEGNVGSGQGNAIVGLDIKWNFLKHFSAYGQFVLDEFRFDRIMQREGWWANKFGGQLGLKYFDVANIRNLDLQLEYNSTRPFTYSHTYKKTSYSHYNQPLAHPLGANFNEFLIIARYQPSYRLSFTGKAFIISQGLDYEDETSYGSNVLKPNTDRVSHNSDGTGHEQLQGLLTKTRYIDFGASYMLIHNLFLDANVTLRNSSNEQGENNLVFFQTGLRLNLAKRTHEF